MKNTLSAYCLFKNVFIVIVVICLILSGIPVVSAETSAVKDITTETSDGDNTYFSYYSKYSEAYTPLQSVSLTADSIAECENNMISVEKFEDVSAVRIDTDNSWCKWEIDVLDDGRYYFNIQYYPLDDSGKDILFSLEIDGELPYNEAKSLMLPRIWKDDIDGEFKKDDSGNDIRPKQIEVKRWCNYSPVNTIGMYESPYFIYLSKGKHTVKISKQSEAFMLSCLELYNETEIQSYSEYIKEQKGTYVSGETVFCEAEKSLEKNSISLYPVYDRTNAATSPSNPTNTVFNTMGKTNWGTVGQSISWCVNVEEAGLYRIAFRVRQKFNQGMNSYRTLRINGEIPFKEAKDISFSYENEWYIKTLGDEGMYVYLEDGDVISLEIEGGVMAKILRNINQSVLQLNEIYRKIILITGVSPDIYQDYNLDKKLPDLLPELNEIKKNLEITSTEITEIMGEQAKVLTATIDRNIEIYNDLIEKPYTIPERLDSYKSSIENLSSLIISLGTQPLELDYIAFVPQGNELPRANAGFWDSIVYGFTKFISSFTQDYSTVSLKHTASTVKVWIATGRDQAQILNNLILSNYSQKYNAKIQLSIVDTGNTLIQATLAGKGPDVALQIPESTPVNLAMRGELVALDNEKYDISDIKNQFAESAFQSFYYQDKLYALPETQNFDVLFYRTDIFEQLGLTVPETWEEFYEVLRALQNNNLMVAIPETNSATPGISASISMFNRLLLQNGGSYYNEELSKSAFNSETALYAFTQWVELYTKYGLSRDVNFYNRFRSGEVAMGIMNYNQYNLIASAAKELNGLWNIALVPGTVMSDGSINRTETSLVNACMMLNAAVERKVDSQAFEFMKWWVSEETQTEFGRDLEASLGIAARYTPANLNSLKKMGWNDYELSVLENQLLATQNIPEIPGNYVVPRSLTAALRSAVSETYTPARALNIYDKEINSEIHRKRVEFGLEEK